MQYGEIVLALGRRHPAPYGGGRPLGVGRDGRYSDRKLVGEV
jgi:hypothetical protein